MHDRFGKVLFAVDGRESIHWMRYVRYARHEGEKNLVAIQYERNVYYKTVSNMKINRTCLYLLWKLKKIDLWAAYHCTYQCDRLTDTTTSQGKEVGPNTELLVWYSTSYAQTLRIPSAGQITPDGEIYLRDKVLYGYSLN